MRRIGGGRRCRRCGEAIQWARVRLVRPRAYCCEACAVLALLDEASGAAWAKAALQVPQGPRHLRRCVRLIQARWRAAVAQRRLDRRLEIGPRAGHLPWGWRPIVLAKPQQRWAIAGLAFLLVAWGAASGRAPESPVTLPTALPAAPTPSVTPIGFPVPTPPSPAPGPRSIARVSTEDFTRGSKAITEIAFTFDGHGEANVTSEILDILQARGVRATMFLGGQFIRLFPDLVRRMVAEGHEIANHTDTHPHLTTYATNRRHETLPGVTRELLINELRRAEMSFRALTGRPMAPYWRAPYGEHNSEIRGWVAEAGFRHVGWTRGAGVAEDLDTRDWVADTSSRIYRTRGEIAKRILEFGRGRPGGLSGGIVLMHLATNRKTDRPHEGLPEILKTLQAQGYRLVTISELLAVAGPGGDRASRPSAPIEARLEG